MHLYAAPRGLPSSSESGAVALRPVVLHCRRCKRKGLRGALLQCCPTAITRGTNTHDVVGAAVGDAVGAAVGTSVGAAVGISVGDSVGAIVGAFVGATVSSHAWLVA